MFSSAHSHGNVFLNNLADAGEFSKKSETEEREKGSVLFFPLPATW